MTEYSNELQTIAGYLRDAAGLEKGEVGPDTRILDSGLLDSLGVVQLMTFLADKMGVEISDEDFVAEHFETVETLARFVASKRGVSSR